MRDCNYLTDAQIERIDELRAQGAEERYFYMLLDEDGDPISLAENVSEVMEDLEEGEEKTITIKKFLLPVRYWDESLKIRY